jgi:hypothetical protein
VNGEAMEFLRMTKPAFAKCVSYEIQRKTGYNNVYTIMLPKRYADFVMNARLTDESFTGAIQERFHEFIRKVESLSIA